MIKKDALPKKTNDSIEAEKARILEQYKGLTLTQIKKDFDSVLKDAGLYGVITSKTVITWINQFLCVKESQAIFMLFSLFYQGISTITEDEFLEKSYFFCNYIISHDPVKSKILAENEKNKKEEGYDLHEMYVGDILENYHKGIVNMQKQNMKKGLDYFNKVLFDLHKREIVIVDIFRLFANMAVCYASQDDILAEPYMTISQKINKNYAFARNQYLSFKKNGVFENAEFKEFTKFISEFSKKKQWIPKGKKFGILEIKKLCYEKIKNEVSESIGVLYYNWYVTTGINMHKFPLDKVAQKLILAKKKK